MNEDAALVENDEAAAGAVAGEFVTAEHGFRLALEFDETYEPARQNLALLLETDGADATQVVYTLQPQVYGNVVSERDTMGW